MLVHNRKFKLSMQVEYTFFASYVSFSECSPTIDQLVNFPLKIYNSRKILDSSKS